MRTNSDTLPKKRRYELFKEMQIRTEKSGTEAFAAKSLRKTLNHFGRNAANLRKDLEELAHEGLVFKSTKLNPIVMYKPDGPSSSIQAGRIRENFKARLNDLRNLILLARENTHFECQRCGRLFPGARVCPVPLFPLRLCPFCQSNSQLGLGIKTRPCVIQ